jgi:Ca2+-binding RTX toxin-like protein
MPRVRRKYQQTNPGADQNSPGTTQNTKTEDDRELFNNGRREEVFTITLTSDPNADVDPLQTNSLSFSLPPNLGFGFTKASVKKLSEQRDQFGDIIATTLEVKLVASNNSRQRDITVSTRYNDSFAEDLAIGAIAAASYNGGANLDGTNQRDFLRGGNGKERINGKAGADYMAGGNGDDTYVVDNLRDYVYDVVGTGVETVESSVTWALNRNQYWFGTDDSDGDDPGDETQTGLDHLKLTGNGNIDGTGNYLSNDITGNNGNNILNGYESITSYNDNRDQQDSLRGNGGADTFVLGQSSSVFYREKGSKDYVIVRDFNPGQRDKIQIGTDRTNYSFVKSANKVGGGALDTQIFYRGDLIAIVQDNTGISLATLTSA